MSEPALSHSNDSSPKTIFGAPEGHDARILADLAREAMRDDKILCHIALDDARTHMLGDLLEFFAPDVEYAIFPAWDCLPYDRVSPGGEIVAQRVTALTKLLEWNNDQSRKPRILITTVNAALQRVMPKAALENASFTAAKGSRINIEQLQSYLAANGYSRTDTVREAGEFSIRGGIIDIFPSGDENPVRLDLFGDEVETIKTFDPATQRSLDSIPSFSLAPVTEFSLTESAVQKFRSGYREAFGVVQSGDPLYEAVSESRRYNGMDHWLPLFYSHMDTLFDYLPKLALTIDLHVRRSHTERLTQIDDFYQARKTLEDSAKRNAKKSKDVSLSGAIYHPLSPEKLYLTETEWLATTQAAVSISPHQSPDETEEGAKHGRDFSDIRALPKGDVFAELKTYIGSRKTLIACYSTGSRERMKGLLENAGFQNIKLIETAEELKKLSGLGLAILTLEHGFDAPDLRVITEQDILGDRLARKSKKKRKADQFLTEISSLNEGDLVVHIDHGVGRFIALETLKVDKTLHDCLKLEYANGDKLFVPVENIEVLSRYGDSDSSANLDKLGGVGWQARKARAKRDLMEMADGLLKIAAARQLKKAPRMDISEGLYNEFAARFPYNETEDQLRAIENTVGDLSRDFPMDRLVCGDVGFGKTEVAMRAAYVAAMNGHQVALVVPTTLLARQHYQNFLKRFAGTGLRIEQFSRMVNVKDIKAAKEGLADGTVNIAIGTHALFAESIKFADLGLLIVDEEQRFGVKQKERLKEIKTNVHVLTLTATPIPRTLQMSLTGVKEMSLIATPPVDRLAVRTFVLPYDPLVLKEALLREHYRGGQSFYVCPRIKDMDAIEEALKELVPEIKVVTAHGQMTPTELEDRMNAFYDGQYGILLATNIIESGIDIPTANTMIVHRSDMFGLAQLYQIRGRIGRSKLRAYCYLTYPADALIGDLALKRLEVMETLDTLGAGFQLASHDMDIRGAGNLLGDKQSGHIREIGVELYQQMLEDAVAAAREGGDFEEREDESWTPVINLGTSVLIPETYVENLNVRMSLYRRLGDLQDADEIESFAAELIDRFGEIPEEVKNLLDIVTIKQMCRIAGVSQIDAGPKGGVLAFHKNAPPNVETLLHWITSKAGTVKLRPDQKLTLIRQWDRPLERVRGITAIMRELSAMSGSSSQ
jgi:transcription-repair coupling factor (superfamily II helicase)